WSNSVNADVGSFSAERNAGQGSSVKYDMLALKNTYTGTNTANIQLPIQFNDSRSLDISSMSSYGYLSFDMYIDTNQTIGSGDMSVAVYSSSGGVTGYKQFAIEPNKWQKITIKLSDMGITGSLSAVKGVRFMCGTTITEAYSIYVQHIGFAIPVSSELISVVKGATGVDLTWYEGILSGTNKYYINRNGVKIAEVSAPATSYTDTTAVDGIVNYTISDVDSSNNILATSPKKYYQEFNSEYSVVSSLYTNANNQQETLNWQYQFGTWNNAISADVGSFTTENAIIGGKSVKYDMQALNNTALDLPLFDNLNTYDIRDIVGTGYVRFAIYVDTDQELTSDAMRFRLETSTGMVHGYRAFSVEENEWQIIYVKLSDIIGDSEMTRAANVNGIKFQCTDAATGKLSFYIQEIDFVTWAGAAVKNVVLTNAAGNTVSNMTDVDTKIVANFDLREFKDVDCVIYAVLYEEDESEVLSFAQTTISLSAGSTESVEVENIIPAEAKTQDCVYKIFVWQENTNIAKSEPFSQLIEE
nr:hypothetical protein [Bacillota bacterium]